MGDRNVAQLLLAIERVSNATIVGGPVVAIAL